MTLDFSRCRDVWVPDGSEAGGFWSPPPQHVRVGVQRIVDQPYLLLADDMGGMKTAQALIAAQFLHDAGEVDRLLVIAPASVRAKVWFDRDLGQIAEQAFADKRLLVSEYRGKIRQWSVGPPDARELRVIVTNYELTRNRRHLDALLPYCGLRTMLVLDESSAVRTWDSQQTEACMRLRWLTDRRGRPVRGAPRCGRVLELNGTPVAESPLDLFSQANLLHPSVLDCRYVTHFRARYAVMAPVRGAGGRVLTNPRTGKPLEQVDHWTNVEDLQRRMAPYVLRREAKELGIDFALPPVGVDVALTTETWRVYREVRDEMVAWLKSGVATARQAGVKALRLAQVTSGFIGGVEDEPLHEEGDALDLPGSFLDGLVLKEDGAEELNAQRRHFDRVLAQPPYGPHVVEVGREKLDWSLEWQAGLLRRDPDLRLLLWCRFVPELRRHLRAVREAFGHPVGAASGSKILEWVEGTTVKEEREAALRMLHPKTAQPGPCTVGATQGTGAIGLNFTACRTVLDVSYDASAFKKRQGDARTNRPGQTGPVSSHYLVAVGPRGQKTVDHFTTLARLGKIRLADLTVAGWVRALEEE